MPSDFWKRRVNRVMDFVREDPSRDVALEDLSRVANSSSFHFHRIFKAITGETVAGFVRRTRLERAAYLMQASPRRRLTSIALDVGFPSMSEFSRVFRREYGIPPSRWNRQSRLAADDTLCEPKRGNRENSHAFDGRIVRHAGCRVAFVRIRTVFDTSDLRVGFERLTTWLERENVDWRSEKMLGMSWDNYHTTPLDRVHYDLAFTVPVAVQASGDVGIRELPALKAVEVHCRGSLRIIADAWDYLYDEWFPESQYVPSHLPPMKRFRRRPDELDWQSWDLDCSIALEEAMP